MSKLNPDVKYSTVAMTLHWLIAAAIIFMLYWGRYMHDLPRGTDERLEAYWLHESIGLTILMLTAFRIFWRIKKPVAALTQNLKPIEVMAQRITHIGFYALLLLLPLSGWVIVSTSSSGNPIFFFELFNWPLLPGISEMEGKRTLHVLFEDIHHYLGYAMIALLALHLAGIIKHTFILKDGILKRMMP